MSSSGARQKTAIREKCGTRGKVLVLGDDTRAFLACVRSLGRKGIEVHAAPIDFSSVALKSRYLSHVHWLPYYVGDGCEWLEATQQLVRAEGFDMLLPCNERSLLPLHRYREQFPKVALAIPGSQVMKVFFDKYETRKLAQSLSIPVPSGRLIEAGDSAELLVEEFGLPAFVKPRRSYSLDTLDRRAAVQCVESAAQLSEVLAHCGSQTHLIESSFPGNGVGVSVLTCEGEIRLAFQHRRVREGVAGGFYRVSEHLLPHLLDTCARLTRAVAHSGLAMFEFRHDVKTGAWALLEINARPWGSMPLAVAAGVDFPYAWYEMLTWGRTTASPEYPSNRFGRNLMLDIPQILSEARRALHEPGALIRLAGELCVEAGRVVTGRESQDCFVLDDPMPGLSEVAKAGRSLVSRVDIGLEPLRRRKARNGALLREHLRATGSEGKGRLVFVCQGNICRSPFAEAALKRQLSRTGSFSISSAGMIPRPGRQPPEQALEAARILGYDISEHRSSHFGAREARQATVLIVFDRTNVRSLQQRYPKLAVPVMLLSDVVEEGPYPREIMDPESRDLEFFVATYRRIDAACARLAQSIDDALK